MKIELKNIQHSALLSEESEAFAANLYINGIHAGYAKNRGNGGNTLYESKDDDGKKLIEEAEAYCKTLPPKNYSGTNGREGFSMDMDLEQKIDDLLYAYLREKDLAQFNRKLERAMDKGFVYGIPDDSFQSMPLQTRPEILLGLSDGPIKLEGIIKKHVLPQLTDGKILLNTNIREEILIAAGLKEGQYVKPKREQTAKTVQKKKAQPKKKP